MAISVDDIKQLRDKTGAGMMACKEALTATNGDVEAAVAHLRKKGIASAEKKASRTTGDGLVAAVIAADGRSGAIIEINCETDFVAKTDQFQQLAGSLAQWTLGQPNPEVTAEALPEDLANQIKEVIAKIGENIKLKRGSKLTVADGLVESYIHLGGKIGVLVALEAAAGTGLKPLAKELAMQVAASSPLYIKREQVPAEAVEKEKDIYREQVRGSGKPEKVVENIVAGKLKKYYSEICLLEQAYIKDPNKTVEAVIREQSAGGAVAVSRFVRYRLGE
jgi:elongation factor Ts